MVEEPTAVARSFAHSRAGEPVGTREPLEHQLGHLSLSFWGKGQPAAGAAAPYHPIAYHLLDVAAVTQALLVTRPLVAKRAAGLLDLSADDARTLLVTLAALHDLGKFAPAFQAKAPELWPTGALGPYDPAAAVQRAHTDDGYALWDDVLGARVGERILEGGADVLAALAPAIFGHHGRPVREGVGKALARQRFPGCTLIAAITCAESVLDLLCPRPIRALVIDESKTRLASWWVAGLVTVADWVGSNQHWFPYTNAIPDDTTLAAYWTHASICAERAVCEAGLTPPAAASEKSFGALTQIEGNPPPTPLQQWATTVELPDGPLLVVIEDVTGSGKTEAAQMLVHRLMAAGRASGAYWAMPTMATANAMYERQASALTALFAPDGAIEPSLVLAHGQQRLHERFRSRVLGAAGSESEIRCPREAGDEELPSSAACAAFLADDRRAALLADVGAGTIDQAVLGALPSKFNTVRLFGLADKVLVVDEAHAYDAYLSVEVQELLRFQAALGGCAVVLSATLAHGQREALAQAWADGAAGGGRVSLLAAQDGRVELASSAYPLATLVTSGPAVQEAPLEAASWSSRCVGVQFVHELQAALDHVDAAAARGAAVAWVRNTVDDCLAAAALLRERGIDVLVFHARFAQGDRQRRESEVLARFGKAAPEEARRGQVLVATQVIEQSLDLDFDAMVSDVAPIDLLVQRAGRLWRHPARDAGRPAELTRELVVLSPAPAEEPPEAWLGGVFSGTAHVYEDAGVLWRTVQALDRTGVIHTPDGLRDLIESVYGSSEVPQSLLPAAQRAEGKEGANAAAATYATLRPTDGYDGSAHAWLSDLRVPTRLGDEQTTVRLARVQADGSLAPWVQAEGPAWRSWALSEVRVAAYRVPPRSTADRRHDDAVARARAGWGRFEQEIPVLPLEETMTGCWEGVLTTLERKARRLSYTLGDGLAYPGASTATPAPE